MVGCFAPKPYISRDKNRTTNRPCLTGAACGSISMPERRETSCSFIHAMFP
jgi:hypothetical protein